MAQEQSLFSGVVSLQQKSDGEMVFLAVFYPNPKAGKLVELTEAIKANKQWIYSLLYETDAILFRGFPVFTASDFNDVTESSGYNDFPYDAVVEDPELEFVDIFTLLMNHAIEFPSKLFFFCEVEPGGRGETCVVQSHVIYDKMKQKHLEFVQHLEEKSLTYRRVSRKEFDPSSPAGHGWKAIFMTDDESLAEERYPHKTFFHFSEIYSNSLRFI